MKPHLFAMTPLLVALCLGPSPAFAQVSEPDRAAARALGKEGHDALDNKDFATAADRFSKANAIIEAPTFLLGLAQAQVGLGKLVAARETYRLILKDPLPESAPAAFVKAVETAKTESAALDVRLPHVIVQVAGAASVQITLDGEALSSEALGAEHPVDPGSHVIRAHGAGFEDLEIRVDSALGKTQTVTLEPKPAIANPVVQLAPVAPLTPKVAPRKPARPAELPLSFGQAHRGSLAVLGVGAGLAAAGGVLGGLALSDFGSSRDGCVSGSPCPGMDGVRAKVIAADVLFGAAGAAAVTAVVLFTIGERRARAVGIYPYPAGVAVKF